MSANQRRLEHFVILHPKETTDRLVTLKQDCDYDCECDSDSESDRDCDVDDNDNEDDNIQ